MISEIFSNVLTSQGMVSEFNVPKDEDPKSEKNQFQWLYTNGLLGVIFSFGLLYTALKSRKARSWWYGTGLSMHQLSLVHDFNESMIAFLKRNT